MFIALCDDVLSYIFYFCNLRTILRLDATCNKAHACINRWMRRSRHPLKINIRYRHQPKYRLEYKPDFLSRMRRIRDRFPHAHIYLQYVCISDALPQVLPAGLLEDINSATVHNVMFPRSFEFPPGVKKLALRNCFIYHVDFTNVYGLSLSDCTCETEGSANMTPQMGLKALKTLTLRRTDIDLRNWKMSNLKNLIIKDCKVEFDCGMLLPLT